jgi:hypothetical protein
MTSYLRHAMTIHGCGAYDPVLIQHTLTCIHMQCIREAPDFVVLAKTVLLHCRICCRLTSTPFTLDLVTCVPAALRRACS